MIKNIKKVLSVLLCAMLVISGISTVAFAQELVTLIESPLTDMSAAIDYTGFSNATWAAGRCGLSGRTVYYSAGLANTVEKYIIFDVGENNLAKTITANVTLNTIVRFEITNSNEPTGTMSNGSIFKYSNDGDVYTDAGQGTYTFTSYGSADGGVNNYYNYTLDYTLPEDARYIKLDATIFGECNFFIHNIVIKGTSETVTPVVPSDELIIDTDLKDNSAAKEVSGFETVTWASARCGFTEARPIYTAMGIDSYMIFDAGEGGGFTTAYFEATTHPSYTWTITDPGNIDKMCYISADGEEWTAVTGGTYVMTDAGYDGSILHRNFDITWNITSPARYVKLKSNCSSANSLFVHGAKLYGTAGTTPEPEPDAPATEAEIVYRDTCAAITIPTNEYLNAVYNDFQAVNWEVNWFEDGRSYTITSKGVSNDIPDTITYSVKDIKHDIVSFNWKMAEQQVGVSSVIVPQVSFSKDGVIWSDGIYAEITSTNSIPVSNAWQFKMVEYKAEIPADGMKYARIDFSGNNCRLAWVDVGLNVSTNPLDMIEFDTDNSKLELKNNAWTATGKINCSTEELTSATLLLGVYKNGKMISLTPQVVSLAGGVIDFAVSQPANTATSGTVAELYLWTSQADMVPIAVDPVVGE